MEDMKTLTRSGFEALIAAMIQAIAQPAMKGDTAIGILKSQFGLSDRFTSNLAHYGEGSTRWEHPLLTQHNRACGTRGILNQGFFTLYASVHDFEEYRSKTTWHGINGSEVIEAVTPAHSTGYVEFCLGRIGNTYSIGLEVNVIPDPPAPPDDRQADLFGEVSNVG